MQLPFLSCARTCFLTLLAAVAAIPTTTTAQSPRFEVVAKGLEHPWAVAFMGDGSMLVTERSGRLRVVAANGALGEPVLGLPAVDARGQGGLLDVVTDSAFRQNRTLYFCFSESAPAGQSAQSGQSGNSTALARARLSTDARSLEAVQVIFRQVPKVNSTAHFGCRIVEALKNGQPDGTLFLTLGERFSRMQDAQTLDNHHGKVVRVGKDGSVPKDNPFVNTAGNNAGIKPEIWSYGHRNPQGAALSPDGTLWMHEHGPQGGDEINLPQPGENYGWPVITYGENYGGGKIGEGLTAKTGMEQPLHYWVPSIAPSGMAFVSSDKYGASWRGNLLVGSLKFGYLDRIVLQGRKVIREEKLLTELNQRIRDVRQGPDGLIYVLTDASNGQLIRLLPP
jgi:aldose sugar dehydrogenase